MKKMTHIMLFRVGKFERYSLDRADCAELHSIALNHDDDETQIYELEEFCELCNSQEIDLEEWWIYPITTHK